MKEYEYPISTIALGVFWGWFLIKLFIKMHGGIKNIVETMAKYFETKDSVDKILKDMKEKK